MGVLKMIRTRKDKGYFIGLYLEKQQYDIVQAVSAQTHQTVSDLIRIAIATCIEPKYQANLADKVAVDGRED
jgi:hypothetical protein